MQAYAYQYDSKSNTISLFQVNIENRESINNIFRDPREFISEVLLERDLHIQSKVKVFDENEELFNTRKVNELTSWANKTFKGLLKCEICKDPLALSSNSRVLCLDKELHYICGQNCEDELKERFNTYD
jgi:formylmethanofuran dehydrogenase subunit E